MHNVLTDIFVNSDIWHTYEYLKNIAHCVTALLLTFAASAHSIYDKNQRPSFDILYIESPWQKVSKANQLNQSAVFNQAFLK